MAIGSAAREAWDERFRMICAAGFCERTPQGGVSLRELAERHEVSFEYVRKIRKQQLQSGRMERTPQRRHSLLRRVNEEPANQIRELVERQPDLTLE